ncbi:hypothetical protein SDC9_184061 [bioreactor metagenome]|uniref:Uncharacterized protein n=1 Tax=bioreactor metagenome TaxID=1076179 RepID=A0A645HDW2_9ZZZZ
MDKIGDLAVINPYLFTDFFHAGNQPFGLVVGGAWRFCRINFMRDIVEQDNVRKCTAHINT